PAPNPRTRWRRPRPGPAGTLGGRTDVTTSRCDAGSRRARPRPVLPAGARVDQGLAVVLVELEAETPVVVVAAPEATEPTGGNVSFTATFSRPLASHFIRPAVCTNKFPASGWYVAQMPL